LSTNRTPQAPAWGNDGPNEAWRRKYGTPKRAASGACAEKTDEHTCRCPSCNTRGTVARSADDASHRDICPDCALCGHCCGVGCSATEPSCKPSAA
jgi:hypothetical protein